MVGELKLAHPSVACYADCGMLISGPFGREVLAVGQELVLAFVMDVHILTLGVAMNAMTDYGACTIIFSVVGLTISFLLGLPKTFKNISHFSYFCRLRGSVTAQRNHSLAGLSLRLCYHSSYDYYDRHQYSKARHGQHRCCATQRTTGQRSSSSHGHFLSLQYVRPYFCAHGG